MLSQGDLILSVASIITCLLMTLKTQSPVQMLIPEQLLIDVPEPLQIQQVQMQILFLSLAPALYLYLPSKPVSSVLFSTTMKSTNI